MVTKPRFRGLTGVLPISRSCYTGGNRTLHSGTLDVSADRVLPSRFVPHLEGPNRTRAQESQYLELPPGGLHGPRTENRLLDLGRAILEPALRHGLDVTAPTDLRRNSAMESPMRIVYRISVIKGMRSIEEVQYETDEYYATTGFATTIDEASKKAVRYMMDYLMETKGLSREQAYMLCSLAGDLKIAETVDIPHMLVTMHMPKGIFRGAGTS